MSYILDALRRAEAQRSRGAVPTLHAPVLGPGAAAAPEPTRRAGVVAGLVVLGLVAIVAMIHAWRLNVRQDAPPAPPVTMAPPAVPVPLPGAPPPPPTDVRAAAQPSGPVAPPLPAAVESAPRPMPPNDAPRRPPPTPPTAAAPPPAGPRPAPAPLDQRSPPGSSMAAPAPASAAPGPAEPPSVREPSTPLQRHQLPPDVQRELPALALNGTVYSSDPSQRVVLVNGEVWREGDRLAPGLQVDEIRRKDVVLRYKGQRFILGP